MRKNFHFSTFIVFSLVAGSVLLFTSAIFAQGGFPTLEDFSLQTEDDGDLIAGDNGIYLPEEDAAALGGEGLIIEETGAETPHVTMKAPVSDPTPAAEPAAPKLPPAAVPPGANTLPPSPKFTVPAVPAPSTADYPTADQGVTQQMLSVPAQKPSVAVQAAPAPEYVSMDARACRLFCARRNLRRADSYVIPAPIQYPPQYYESFGWGHGGRGPMIDPYYTLRGPRHFDDPNPRPIGP